MSKQRINSTELEFVHYILIKLMHMKGKKVCSIAPSSWKCKCSSPAPWRATVFKMSAPLGKVPAAEVTPGHHG
jgi:hypothetical protein